MKLSKLQAIKVTVGAALLLFLPGWVNGGEPASSSTLKQLMRLETGDFPKTSWGFTVEDVAISADNSRLAVVVDIGEAQGVGALWVQKWEISPKRLIAKAVLGSGSEEFPHLDQFERKLEFNSRGDKLVVQTHRQVYVLNAATLERLYSVPALDVDGRARSGIIIRNFSVSHDGTVLGVLSGEAPYPGSATLFRLFSLESGKEIARWPFYEKVRSIALSSDGRGLVVTLLDSPTPTDILVLDSSSGKSLSAFASGFGYGLGYGAWDASFIGTDQVVATPGFSTDARGRYSGDALKIFDVRSGRLSRELTYKHFGPTGILGVAQKSSLIATLNFWMSPREVFLSDLFDLHKHAQLLFFKLDQKLPFCLVDPVPEKVAFTGSSESYSSLLRFSPDLNLTALFTDKRVIVYQPSACDRSPFSVTLSK